MGIDTSTFYYWRKKYGGMEVEYEALKGVGGGNRKLKQMYADVSLDVRMLKDVLSKKVLGPSDKKHRAKYLQESYYAKRITFLPLVGPCPFDVVPSQQKGR